MFNNWTEEELLFLRENYQKYSNKELGNILNKKPSNIKYVLSKLKLKKTEKQRGWSKEETEELIRLYNKKIDLYEIAKTMKRSRMSIANKSNELGITIPPCKKDRGDINFFKKIDTSEKAYWLGFIYADGYVVETKANAELGIELARVDREHLLKFNKIFNNYFKIIDRTRENKVNKNFDKNKHKKMIEMSSIRVYSKDLVRHLINNGIVPNKTNSKIHPIIDDERLFFDFLRGYIDGDGSYVLYNKLTYPVISLVSNNKSMLLYIKKKLKAFSISSKIYKDGLSWKIQIRKKESCLKLINLMFTKKSLYLDRKYEKIKNFIK